MESNKVIFVFYTLETPGSWSYKLPKGWNWIGAGSTGNPKYSREEQFGGPQSTKKETLKYLDKIFSQLKRAKTVKQYKIRQSYLP